MGKNRKKSPVSRKRKATFYPTDWRRRLLIIFLLSFFISTALIVYVFGMTGDFFLRLFWCLLVVFLLLSLTALGIIPLVNWLGNKWLK